MLAGALLALGVLLPSVTASAAQPAAAAIQTFANLTLRDSACPTTTTCFAVGDADLGPYVHGVLVATREAGVWTAKPLPMPAGITIAQLTSIACPTSTWCIAVGGNLPRYELQPLVAVWQGGVWTTSSPVALNGLEPSQVACTGVNACVVAGERSHPALARLTAQGWSPLMPLALPGNYQDAHLTGLSCSTPTDCMTVGWAQQLVNLGDVQIPITRTVAYRLHGSAVTRVLNAGPLLQGWRLEGVTCAKPYDCLAVGTKTFFGEFDAFGQYLLRWNGFGWKQSALTVAPGDTRSLNGRITLLGCTGTASCRVIASTTVILPGQPNTYLYTSSAGVLTGSTLTLGAVDPPAPFASWGGSCLSDSLCTAVAGESAIYRWNGLTWAKETLVLPPH
jgi:hypothetical protein